MFMSYIKHLMSLYEGLGVVLIEAQCAGCCCVASTEVPTIAKVTENLEFLNLSDQPNVWADKISDSTNDYQRKDYTKEITKNGYEIKNEVKKLEKKYSKFQSN